MFIRRRKNKSGTTSVVVVDKSSGKFRERIAGTHPPHRITRSVTQENSASPESPKQHASQVSGITIFEKDLKK